MKRIGTVDFVTQSSCFCNVLYTRLYLETQDVGSIPIVSSSSLPASPFLDEAVDDRAKEHNTDTDRASEDLDGVEGLSQDKCHADNDDNSLGGVGNGLRDGLSLLQGQVAQSS
jgi:hypothetical protein